RRAAMRAETSAGVAEMPASSPGTSSASTLATPPPHRRVVPRIATDHPSRWTGAVSRGGRLVPGAAGRGGAAVHGVEVVGPGGAEEQETRISAARRAATYRDMRVMVGSSRPAARRVLRGQVWATGSELADWVADRNGAVLTHPSGSAGTTDRDSLDAAVET